jgi:hypothetical protein
MERQMTARSRPVSIPTIAGAGLVAAGLIGAGFHFSGSDAGSTIGLTASSTAAVTVICPDVASKVGNVPAAAQAGVNTELANLARQIVNVNDRLSREPGQAANQLNDIAGKRNAVIDRIIKDITRVGGTEPAGLFALVDCKLSTGAAAGGAAAGGAAAGGGAAAATTKPAAAAPAGGGAAAASGAQTVNCPAVEGSLPAIPASAQAEVTRNLALLNTQIAEANARLAKIFVKPEGGPAFIQNAILGPLEGKRASTLDRIAISIGRTAAKPTNLGGLAKCGLNAGGAAAGGAVAATTKPAAAKPAKPAGNAAAGATGKAQTVNCPAVQGALPAIPASAQAEITRNLALLDTQIAEANARLAKIFVKPEGGPAFIQNAILGPLEDKRFATLNRMATAIGRTAAKPTNLDELAPCTLKG